MSANNQLWLSFDVEATGPVPGLHSMLSLGIVAYDGNTRESVDAFEVNIRPLESAAWDPDTWAWWRAPERASALAATTERQVMPHVAMSLTLEFLRQLRSGYPNHAHVFAAYPATFDMPFLTYYMSRFCHLEWVQLYDDERTMERIACFDVGSYVAARLGVPYHEVSRKQMPAHWLDIPPNKHEHVAICDARHQGDLLMKVLAWVGSNGPVAS